jgi:hypothetical protein
MILYTLSLAGAENKNSGDCGNNPHSLPFPIGSILFLVSTEINLTSTKANTFVRTHQPKIWITKAIIIIHTHIYIYIHTYGRANP